MSDRQIQPSSNNGSKSLKPFLYKHFSDSRQKSLKCLLLRQGFFEGLHPSKNPSNPIQPPLNFKLTDH
jgi:hypothetical protein